MSSPYSSSSVTTRASIPLLFSMLLRCCLTHRLGQRRSPKLIILVHDTYTATTTMPLLLMWAAGLLLASSFHHNHVSASTFEQRAAIETLLQIEEKVIKFGVELENAYEKRCHIDTYDTCLNNNYYDCSSKYPNQVCMKADKFNTSNCGDGGSSPISGDGGSSCNGEFVERRSACTDIDSH